jgi:hypothetical protein
MSGVVTIGVFVGSQTLLCTANRLSEDPALGMFSTLRPDVCTPVCRFKCWRRELRAQRRSGVRCSMVTTCAQVCCQRTNVGGQNQGGIEGGTRHPAAGSDQPLGFKGSDFDEHGGIGAEGELDAPSAGKALSKIEFGGKCGRDDTIVEATRSLNTGDYVRRAGGGCLNGYANRNRMADPAAGAAYSQRRRLRGYPRSQTDLECRRDRAVVWRSNGDSD